MKAPRFKMPRNLGLLADGIILLFSQSCTQKTPSSSPIPTLTAETPQPPTETIIPQPPTNSPQPATPSATLSLPTTAIPLPTSTPIEYILPPQFLARLNLGWIEKIALSSQGDWLAAAGRNQVSLHI
jgi:hypothetical protein